MNTDKAISKNSTNSSSTENLNDLLLPNPKALNIHEGLCYISDITPANKRHKKVHFAENEQFRNPITNQEHSVRFLDIQSSSSSSRSVPTEFEWLKREILSIDTEIKEMKKEHEKLKLQHDNISANITLSSFQYGSWSGKLSLLHNLVKRAKK